MTVFLLSLISVVVSTSGQVSVTFTSSPDPLTIAEEDTAVFNCSSNHSAVLINWLLNKTISASTLTPDGIIVNGGGTPVSSLTIPGLVDPFNDTEVQCVAFGFGIGDFSPSPVTLRVQGRPEPVNNLTIVQSNESCCYQFYWIPPFSLPGFSILRYNIDITSTGSILLHSNVSVSQSTYCPTDFGIHTVSIAAVNSVGEGEVFNYDFNVTNSVLLNNELIQQYRDGLQNWIIAIKIELSSPSSSFCISQVSLQETNSTISYNTTNINVITMSQLIATFNISSSVIDDRYYNFTIILSHSSDLYTTNSSHVVIIRSSFFDINSFTVLSTDSTNTSFMCEFVHGSQAIGCYIVMHETSIGLYYITTVLRELRIGSIPGTVEPGQYSISVYDINSDGSVHLYSPAASTLIIVTESLPTVESTFSSSIPLFSINQSTTVNLQSPTVSSCSSTLVTITGGVTLGLSLIVCFASIFINFSIVIWCRKKGNTMRNQEERNPSLPAQYENVEMITGTNANVNNIPTNDCSAYGVVIQRH